jgi:hypothetical protein
MAQMQLKRIGSRGRALLLFCLLAGVYFSGIFNLWRKPDVAPAQNQFSVLAQLSLADSGIVRAERRLSKLDGKTFRRQSIVDSHPASSTLVLTLAHYPKSSAFDREEPYSLVATSPPSDRAPPRLTL